MDLKGILSISGKSGLFKMVSQTKNGLIVESLVDKKRMPTYSTSKISALEDIVILTDNEEEVPLGEVFNRIYEKEDGGDTMSHKAPKGEVISFFEEILPSYDRDRVYFSDMKRVISWYNLLHKNDALKLDEEEDEEAEASTEEEKVEAEGAEESSQVADSSTETDGEEKQAADQAEEEKVETTA